MKVVIAVIIAGGSGTRLWPLSTKDYPKHLLRLTNERSLLQNTYDRVTEIADEVFVITEKSHANYVRQQLPMGARRRVLVEPARRGTASCIILALDEIRRRRLDDQAIFFLWADHLIPDKKAFQASVNQAAKLAESSQKLVFMGVKPTYPSTGFGYIQMGPKIKGYKDGFQLKQFVEKPKAPTAKRYLKSKQYLWNTGYLLGTIDVFEDEIRQHSPRLWNDYQALRGTLLPMRRKKLYLDFMPEAIEYALSEHVSDALVMAGKFDWADVGSFADLHGVSQHDRRGNHVSGDNVELESVHDSYVRNETAMPIAVIELDNVAVIATDDGILVTNKTHAQKVGDIAKKLQAKD